MSINEWLIKRLKTIKEIKAGNCCVKVVIKTGEYWKNYKE